MCVAIQNLGLKWASVMFFVSYLLMLQLMALLGFSNHLMPRRNNKEKKWNVSLGILLHVVQLWSYTRLGRSTDWATAPRLNYVLLSFNIGEPSSFVLRHFSLSKLQDCKYFVAGSLRCVFSGLNVWPGAAFRQTGKFGPLVEKVTRPN